MRVFIAIQFPENVKEDLFQVQQMVRGQSIKGNFTRKENFHLTLRFIGETEIDELDKLKGTVDQITLNRNCFQLAFNKLGQFPRGNKRIIWAGGPSTETLNQLVNNLELSLEGQGYPREGKAFVPHITLGREVVLSEECTQIEGLVIDNIEISVSGVSLMQSTRIKGQLAYIPIYSKEFNLK